MLDPGEPKFRRRKADRPGEIVDAAMAVFAERGFSAAKLADNAVKHTAPGDTVAIGSSYDDEGARLWVRDTGPGVPPEDRELIFERFGRSAVPPGDEGFGLGLSIVGAIARAHGGGVTVEEATPRGARFVITLPAVAKEDPWPAS